MPSLKAAAVVTPAQAQAGARTLIPDRSHNSSRDFYDLTRFARAGATKVKADSRANGFNFDLSGIPASSGKGAFRPAPGPLSVGLGEHARASEGLTRHARAVRDGDVLEGSTAGHVRAAVSGPAPLPASLNEQAFKSLGKNDGRQSAGGDEDQMSAQRPPRQPQPRQPQPRQPQPRQPQPRQPSCPITFPQVVPSQPVTTLSSSGGRQFRMLQGHFRMRATFPPACGCDQFQYRQGIKGYFYLIRGGRGYDLSLTMNLPHGRLDPNTFYEDGNTTNVAVNYGHRDQPAEPTNHYLDASGREDMHNGCTYEGEDSPGLLDPAPTNSGDIWSVNLQFQGQIVRGGAPVQTQHWTAISGNFPTP